MYIFLAGTGEEGMRFVLGTGTTASAVPASLYRGGRPRPAGGGAPRREGRAFGVGWDVIDSREELSQ